MLLLPALVYFLPYCSCDATPKFEPRVSGPDGLCQTSDGNPYAYVAADLYLQSTETVNYTSGVLQGTGFVQENIFDLHWWHFTGNLITCLHSGRKYGSDGDNSRSWLSYLDPTGRSGGTETNFSSDEVHFAMVGPLFTVLRKDWKGSWLINNDKATGKRLPFELEETSGFATFNRAGDRIFFVTTVKGAATLESFSCATGKVTARKSFTPPAHLTIGLGCLVGGKALVAGVLSGTGTVIYDNNLDPVKVSGLPAGNPIEFSPDDELLAVDAFAVGASCHIIRINDGSVVASVPAGYKMLAVDWKRKLVIAMDGQKRPAVLTWAGKVIGYLPIYSQPIEDMVAQFNDDFSTIALAYTGPEKEHKPLGAGVEGSGTRVVYSWEYFKAHD